MTFLFIRLKKIIKAIKTILLNSRSDIVKIYSNKKAKLYTIDNWH